MMTSRATQIIVNPETQAFQKEIPLPNSLVIVNPETSLLITAPVFMNHAMLSAKICGIVVGRNPFRITQNVKSLGSLCLWCSKSTHAASQEANFDLGDSTEIGDHGEVRPFEDIPGPKRSLRNVIAFYRRSEGLRKNFRNTQALFEEHGPIFKSNLTGNILMVHILDQMITRKYFELKGSILKDLSWIFGLSIAKGRIIFPD